MLYQPQFKERIYHEPSAPRFEKSGDVYMIRSNGGYSIGAYIASSPLATVKEPYILASVTIEADGYGTRAMALLLFYDAEGNKLQSDFLAKQGGQHAAYVRIPDGAAEVSLELLCYSFDGGARFSAPRFEEVPAPQVRSVTVASAFIKREGSVESNMRAILSLIDRAGTAEEKPDIICFTESVYDLGVKPNVYISDTSPDVLRVREASKRNAIYVLFTFHEDDGYRYNTAILIDPNGEIIGKYRKVQPTLGELRLGIAPGRELPVFELPFAKIGVLICWDQYFYETSRALVRRGAEVILWPSRGYHEERMLTRARDNGVYYVCAHPLPDRCAIAGPAGWKILARGEGEEGYTTFKIDLTERPVSEYKSFGKNGGNDKEIYLNEVRRELYR